MSGHQIGRFPPWFLVNYNCLISLWSSRLFSDWLLVTVRLQACFEGVTAGCPAHEGRLHGNFDGLPLVHIKREISEEKRFGSIYSHPLPRTSRFSLWNKICSWILFSPHNRTKEASFSPKDSRTGVGKRSTGGAPAAPSLAPCVASPSSFTPLYTAPPSYSSCFAPGLWCMANYQLLLGQAMSGRSGDCTPLRQNKILTGRSSVVITANERFIELEHSPPTRLTLRK